MNSGSLQNIEEVSPKAIKKGRHTYSLKKRSSVGQPVARTGPLSTFSNHQNDLRTFRTIISSQDKSRIMKSIQTDQVRKNITLLKEQIKISREKMNQTDFKNELTSPNTSEYRIGNNYI